MNLYDIKGEKITQTLFNYPSTVVVAASNSAPEDKEIADYVCDGKNDEVEIQAALNTFASKSGTVLLCNGTYNIESLYDTGSEQYGKFGLYVSKQSVNHNVAIKGVSKPSRVGTYSIGCGATINLGIEAYETLGDDEKLTILGALGPKQYPNLNLTIENIGFNVPGVMKKIIVIDLEYCSNARIDYVLMGLSNDAVPSPTPNQDYVGIRCLPGFNFGTGYYINNCFLWGFGVAFDVGGEHLIMQGCGCRFCDITYRFNAYDNPGRMSHPNTLINCCEEECVRSMYFCKSDRKQSISLIDFNIEERETEYPDFPRSTKAVEERPGDFRGIIIYTANKENYINYRNVPFWEEGSGIHFRTINTVHQLAGTSTERLTYSPNLMQDYYDTTLGKRVFYNGTDWVDMNGNKVDEA